MIHGICKLGIVDEAARLIKQMENFGHSPNVFTYTTVIDGFHNASNVDEAINVSETVKKKNVAPNEAT